MASGRPLGDEDLFDAHVMTDLTRKIIEEAHHAGNCVIVGRGAQCILEYKPDSFTSLFTPRSAIGFNASKSAWNPARTSSSASAQSTETGPNTPTALRQNWCDLHLYDLMIRSRKMKTKPPA